MESECRRRKLKVFRDYFQTHDRVRSFDLHNAKVHSVSWNCDGRKLASGSYDKQIAISSFDGSKLKAESFCKGHVDQVDQVTWHPNIAELFASASEDKTIRLWDLRCVGKKGSVLQVATKGQNINVGWSPDGSLVGFGDKDDRFHLLEPRAMKIIHTESFKSETNEFAWGPSGKFLFIASGEGRIFIYKMPEMQQYDILRAHPPQSNCISIKIDPRGELMAIGGSDAVISIWDLKNLVCLRTVDRLDYPVRAVSFSYDGELLAACSEDHMVDISFTQTVQRAYTLRTEGESYTIAWHPSKYILAFSGGEDQSRDRQENRQGSVKIFGLPSSSD